MYCLNMLAIALELAQRRSGLRGRRQQVLRAFPVHRGRDELLRGDGGRSGTKKTDSFTTSCTCRMAISMPMRVRSMVGLIPLFAVETLEPELIDRLPGFQAAHGVVSDNMPGSCVSASLTAARLRRTGMRTSAFAGGSRSSCVRMLRYMLDENEFLSPHGIRALSKFHVAHPFMLAVERERVSRGLRAGGIDRPVCSAETRTGADRSGFRVNYLMIESLQKFHHYFGDDFRVEYPTGSGQQMTLWDVARSCRGALTHIFLRDENGRRPVFGADEKFQNDPYLRDYDSVLRVFSRRHRRGVGSEPSDRVDCAGGEAS